MKDFLKQLVEVKNCSMQPAMDNSHLATNPICERVCLVRDMDECGTWTSDGFSDSDPDDTWGLSSKRTLHLRVPSQHFPALSHHQMLTPPLYSDLLIVTQTTRLYIQRNPVW